MERYVCPPWYRCRCPPGKPVSESTMLRHMRAANGVRKSLGRGLCRRGPKIFAETTNIYDFGCSDSLEDHPSDIEDSAAHRVIGTSVSPLVNQGCLTADQRPIGNSEQILAENHSARDAGNVAFTQSEGLSIHHAMNDDDGMDDPTHEGNRGVDDATIDHACEDIGESIVVDNDMNNWTGHDEEPIFGTDNLLFIGQERVGSRIPGLIFWLQENHGWVELFYKHGLTYTAMDDILKLIESPCLSWKTVISNITEATPVVAEDYPVCPGHMCCATLTGAAEVTNCDTCGNEKPPQEMMRPNETVSYIPLVPRIKSIISDENLSEQLYSYRRNHKKSSDGVLRDYFDSKSFASLCNMYGGEGHLEHDIFISASTDGFQAFKNNSCDVWPLVAVLFNLPPHLRFMAKNILPLMFIPNEVQPKDLQSYLIPFINELQMTLEEEGVQVPLPNGQEMRFRIHLIWFTADLAGLVKISGINGHVGRFPCRFCLVEGFYSPLFQHYYYPAWLHPHSQDGRCLRFYDPRILRPRTIEHTKRTLGKLETARTLTERKRIATESGVKQRSVLFTLPNMKPFTCFPPDIMHLFYNVQRELLNHHLSGMQDGFALAQSEVGFLDEEFISFAVSISGQIAVKPRSLMSYARWKAAEHKDFTLYYSLIILDGYLSKEYLDGLSYFVRMADLCFRPSVSRAEAHELRRLALQFLEHFENFYVRHDRERVNYCKYVIHLLLHLGDSILEYGPLMCAGQYWVEKYIGWIGGRSNAKILPAKSMLKSAWFGEAKRLFFKQRFYGENFDLQDLVDVGGNRFLGPSRERKLANIRDYTNIADLVAAYLVRKHDGLDPSVARLVANKVEYLRLWSRLQFLCGSYSQTAYSEKVVDESFGKSRENARSSCYVSVVMDVTETSADVCYGRIIRLFELDIKDSEINDTEGSRCRGRYKLALIQWVRGLVSGEQGQVFKVGSKETVFGRKTVEDVSIIRRLIGVVEHSVPAGQGASAISARRRKQTYFIDDFQRIDDLLSRSRRSEDGVNRRLRDMETSR